MPDRENVRTRIPPGVARVCLWLLWGLAPILGLFFHAALQQQDELPRGPLAP